MSATALRVPGPGAALALGGLAAALAALPDVRRVAEGGVSPGLVWLGLTGSTALVLGPLLVVARAVPRTSPRLRGALIGCALSAAPLRLLGLTLKVHTHHRPLGAATFALLGLVLVLGSVLVSVRLSTWAAAATNPVRRFVGGLLTLLACASLGLVFVSTLLSETFHRDAVDAGRLLVVAALASRLLEVPVAQSLARRAGVVSWVLLVLLGLATARGPVRAAIHEKAPVLGGPVAWL